MKLIVNHYQGVDNVLRMTVLQDSKHDTVDNFDEVLGLVVNIAAYEVLVDGGFVLVLVDQLAEGEVDAELE